MKRSPVNVIKYIAMGQIAFGIVVIVHNLLLIDMNGTQTLFLTGLLDGIVIILLALFYLLAMRS